MSDDEQASDPLPDWQPGAVRAAVIAVAQELAECEMATPSLAFYETLADRAQVIADGAVAEAIDTQDDTSVVANIRIARRLLRDFGDELFLATEQTADAILARLAAYLLLEGNDGYNGLIFNDAWGAHGDLEWGTIWGIHQDVRDFCPAFIFKVCMRGDVRFLGVECHAPTRRLPDEPDARLRARTMIVSGIPVLAFSPSEVEADSAACAAAICGALAVLAHELLALHGIEHPPRHDFRPKAER